MGINSVKLKFMKKIIQKATIFLSVILALTVLGYSNIYDALCTDIFTYCGSILKNVTYVFFLAPAIFVASLAVIHEGVFLRWTLFFVIIQILISLLSFNFGNALAGPDISKGLLMTVVVPILYITILIINTLILKFRK